MRRRIGPVVALLGAALIMVPLVPPPLASAAGGRHAGPASTWQFMLVGPGANGTTVWQIVSSRSMPAHVRFRVDGHVVDAAFKDSVAEIALPPGQAGRLQLPPNDHAVIVTSMPPSLAPAVTALHTTGLPYEPAAPAPAPAHPQASTATPALQSWLGRLVTVALGPVTLSPLMTGAGVIAGGVAMRLDFEPTRLDYLVKHPSTDDFQTWWSTNEIIQQSNADAAVITPDHRVTTYVDLPADAEIPDDVGAFKLRGASVMAMEPNADGTMEPTVIRYRYSSESVDLSATTPADGWEWFRPAKPSFSDAWDGIRSMDRWDALGHVGDVLGFVSIGQSLWQFDTDFSHGQYAQAAGDVAGAVADCLSLGAVDIGMAIGAAIGDGPGIVVGAVAGLVLGIVGPPLAQAATTFLVSTLGGWLGSLFGSQQADSSGIYAPDLFAANRTGQPVALTVREGGFGLYDIRPTWTAPAVWRATALAGSGWRVDGASVPDLHYEVHAFAAWQTARGWIIPRAAFAAWARRTLSAYGFPPQAVAVFLHRWDSLGQGLGYLAIYPETGAVVGQTAPLSTVPPIPTYRVWFAVSTGPIPPRKPLVPIIEPSHPPALSLWEWGVTFLPPGAADLAPVAEKGSRR